MNSTAGQVARESLQGLALGDGFGDQWFARRDPAAAEMIRARQAPAASRWRWSDDTAMALSVLRALELDAGGEIDQRCPAELFGAAYVADDGRKYGYGMHELLPRLALEPESWPQSARDLFDGQGSLGNGVPFALWSAARNLDDLPGALWCTAEGSGDVDTTCAITGGVVAARTGLAAVPGLWWERCEPLPHWAIAARTDA